MSTGTRRLTGILVVLSLVAVVGACGRVEVRMDDGDGVPRLPRADSGARIAGDQDPLAFLPSGLGAEYDRAVARMVRMNHLLEERQADLFFARQEGAPAVVIDDLGRQVAALDRNYVEAMVAMAEAPRRPGYGLPLNPSPGQNDSRGQEGG